MIFPPIFPIALFLILDIVALLFDLFIITAVAGVFISTFTTGIYFLYTFQKYGWKKMKQRFFTLKGKTATKRFKIFSKLFVGNVIPFINVWAVWDDYKEDLKEKREKKINLVNQEESVNVEISSELETDQSPEVNSDKNSDEKVSENYVSRENPIQRIERERQAKKVNSDSGLYKKGEEGVMSKTQIANQNNSQTKNNIKNKKTVDEEVGGIKTGQDFSDYDSDYKGEKIIDNNIPEYYENILSAQNKKEKEEQEKKREMQGLQKKKSLGEELAQMTRILSSAKEKYGKDSGIVKNLENKYEKINPESRKGVDELTIGKTN